MIDRPEDKQLLRYQIRSHTKKILSNVLMIGVLVLMVLPFWTSFQDFLTHFVMKMEWYRALQDKIVPYELRTVATMLTLIGLPIKVGNAYIEWTRGDGVNEVIYLAWNCIGWQTVALFLITLFTGLSGNHTSLSKIEALLIGLFGTYLLNLFRIGLVVVVYFFIGRPLGIVFHDYFSNILTLTWLFFFWWFSYGYVLIAKNEIT